MGCHYDGLDVETWTRQNLLDIYVLGVRSLEADIRAFHRMIGKRPIRVYVSLDDHHSTDGYMWPPIEVFRGAWACWYHQGADGIQAFNFAYTDNPLHRQAYQEMADPEGLKHLDKYFVLQRRGGGHGASVVPNPEDWSTPRHMYANTNMQAPLPSELDHQGKADTLLSMYLADDLRAEAEHVDNISLHVLLNDPSTHSLPDDRKIQRALIRHFRKVDFLYNSPPRKNIAQRLEVRVNNILLDRPNIREGWLVYDQLSPRVFAVGNNLIGLLLKGRDPELRVPVLIEKLELHVNYNAQVGEEAR
jgi:hypothetical protein